LNGSVVFHESIFQTKVGLHEQLMSDLVRPKQNEIG